MSVDTGSPFIDPSSTTESPTPQSSESYHSPEFLLATSRQSSSMTLGGPSNLQPNGMSLSSWASQISTSLSTLGEQISAISHIVPSGQVVSPDVEIFSARLEAIEQTQSRLVEEIAEIKRQIEETQPKEVAEIPELSKKIEDALATIKLEQARLYPRLLNATVTVSKMSIKPPPTAGGKPPPNFPATKGEFEHLTKERYEDIMKAYGIPIKGDTAAKREALRAFIGLPA